MRVTFSSTTSLRSKPRRRPRCTRARAHTQGELGLDARLEFGGAPACVLPGEACEGAAHRKDADGGGCHALEGSSGGGRGEGEGGAGSGMEEQGEEEDEEASEEEREHEAGELDEYNEALLVSLEEEPALCGIAVVWVQRRHRRKGIGEQYVRVCAL